MSQDSQNLAGFDENIILSHDSHTDSHTGLSDKIEEMRFDADDTVSVKSEKSARSVKSVKSEKSVRSVKSEKSVKSVKSVKSEKSDSETSDDSVVCVNGRKPRAAAISAKQKIGGKMGGKRKFSSSSESSSSSYKPSNLQVKHTPGSATKKKKSDIPSSASAASGSVARITHVVQTSKNGRVIIEGLCVTKKTGQVFYPQDSIYIFKENDENIDDIKKLIDDNKQKWIENGHSAVCFSQTFNGSLPTVIGGFTRGFAKSIFK